MGQGFGRLAKGDGDGSQKGFKRVKEEEKKGQSEKTPSQVNIGSAPLDLDGPKRIMEEAQSLFHCGEVGPVFYEPPYPPHPSQAKLTTTTLTTTSIPPLRF